MPRRKEIQPILEDAVARVMQSAMPRLQEEIVHLAMEQLQGLLAASGPDSSDQLDAALASIQDATTQVDILRQMLEGCARFAPRVAIFVVRSGTVNGWQGAGFEDDEAVKNVGLGTSASLVSRAMNGRTMVSGATRDFDPGFISTVKAPAESVCVVLPLVVKDKVAALIYADGGFRGAAPNTGALTALTRFTGLWLELSGLRKSGATAAEDSAPPPAAAAATVASSAASNISAASYSAPQGSEEDEVHKKARRFAKLLVEEIKLYNSAKVTAGRENHDLYDRLREDIEKSRATYDKRYADGPVASANYFNQELIRILAENDVSLMGSAFPR